MKASQATIIMGSDSDLSVMQEAAAIFDEFEIKYQLNVLSAHRMPVQMFEFAKSAHLSGTKIIIAGAGGSAHLPGMVASLTHLPVIGVPIQSKSLAGVDSLYSIVQMPPGIPVATVAINGAHNAGLLAIQILALNDSALTKKIISYKKKLNESVQAKARKLEKIGYKKYLEGK